MNMQEMMRQAQKLQKTMVSEKEKIDNQEFIAKSSFVTVKMKGTKEIVNVQIATEKIEADDIEMLEDMIMVACNECMKQIDKETEQKLGKYTQGLPGLF